MRVLMFGWEFPPFNSGGLGVACLGLTRALSTRGVEILFVMPRQFDIRAPWAHFLYPTTERFAIETFNSPITPYITGSKYSTLHRSLQSMVYAGDLYSEVARYALFGGELAKRENFDLIYAHDWLSFGAGISAKRATGKPMIAHIHATEFDRSGGGSAQGDVYEIERAGMQTADRVIAVSEYTKRLLVDRYGIPTDKIDVVYNGIDENTAPQIGSQVSRLRALKRSGKKIVLFLGRLTLQKGPDYFLRAAQQVLRLDPNVVFVVSGSGDMEAQMMNLAASLGISSNVYFTGFLQGAERDQMYAAADLFVMPSISEPFGIAPLEAMKIGTPVLISRQSGVSEVVRHALKADFWDIDEMTNQILSVVGHPGLRETLSGNGRMEADRITWNEAAQKIDGIMHELVH